jgi:twitching motility protein PilI
LSLAALAEKPFELLVELERRARAAMAARAGAPVATDEWVGIGFRLGADQFVASRSDIREVLPVPEHVTRVPSAKAWLRGIANLRGQLLTVVDLKAFLGSGNTTADRRARALVLASREVPTGLIVDEVLGLRRFGAAELRDETPAGVVRCVHYLEGCYRRGGEVWPRFSFMKLLEDRQFLNAGENVKA